MWRYPDLRQADIYFKDLGITQNEHDNPYWNGQPQQALDLGWGFFGNVNTFLNTATNIADVECRVITTYKIGQDANNSFIVVEARGGDGNLYQFLFGHVNWANNKVWNVGDVIPKGTPIVKPAIPDWGPHIHTACQLNGKTFKVREIIFNNSAIEPRPSFKVDSRVQMLNPTNLRSEPSVASNIKHTAPQGAICIVTDSKVVDSDGYLWQNIAYSDMAGWSYTGNMSQTDRQITDKNGNIIGNQEEIERLTKENNELKSSNEKLQNQVSELQVGVDKANKAREDYKAFEAWVG